MIENRINDPSVVSSRDIQRILDGGRSPTVQFSRPGYSRRLLQSLNRLCIEFGAQLEVRFYGHYGADFDATALAELPDVRRLSIDCLEQISNENHLLRLACLEQLSFGVYRFDKPNFLGGFAFENLTELSLSGTAKGNFDLSPLINCRHLTDLFIQGHTKNIDVVATLRRLKSLRLSGMPKKLQLSFVNDVATLRSLSLLFGSRSTIDEISHGLLEDLNITWVRGLESLGPLRRFPKLRVLHVKDQLQLRSISVVDPPLRELSVINCKNLEEIMGLESQTRLEHFRASRTKLNLDALLARAWPKSMKILALYSGSEKWNRAAREILDSRGYAEF